MESLGQRTPMPSATIRGAFFPPSPKTSDSDDSTDLSDFSDMATTNFVRALSISWLIHPNHSAAGDVPTTLGGTLPDGFFVNLAGSQTLITQACETMKISVQDLQLLYGLVKLMTLDFDSLTSCA